MLQHSDLKGFWEIVYVVLFSIFLFGVLLLVWADTRKTLLGINGGDKSLAFLRSSPDEKTVDLFVEELHERVRNTLIRKRVRPDDPEVDITFKKSMLDQLKEDGIINDDKYQEVLAQISVKRSKIGFSMNEDG